MCGLKIIKNGGQGEIVEKKSRFIGTVKSVDNEKDAMLFIDEMKKKYWDAKHNCYAVVIGDNNEFTRCSDDGEPSGTAGRPILDVLIKEDIHNAVVVVTRYFGGVLLGTGGLVRAYQSAVKAGLAASEIAVREQGNAFDIVLDYGDLARVQNYLNAMNYSIANISYTDKTVISVIIPVGDVENALIKISEMTCARAVCDDKGACTFLKSDINQSSV